MEAMANVAGTDPVLLDADACVWVGGGRVDVCVQGVLQFNPMSPPSDDYPWRSYWRPNKGDIKE